MIKYLLGVVVVPTVLIAQQAIVLPYRQPDRLVVLRGEPSSPSLADLADFRAGMPALISLEGFRPAGAELLTGSQVRAQVLVGRLTDGWLDQMGLPFTAGGPWRRGDQGVAVLGPALATSQFGGAKAALGKLLRIRKVQGPATPVDAEELRVVGVLATDPVLPIEDAPTSPAFYVPYAAGPNELASRGPRALTLIGRLRNPAEFDLAVQQAKAVARRLAEGSPRNQGTDVRLAWLRNEVGDRK